MSDLPESTLFPFPELHNNMSNFLNYSQQKAKFYHMFSNSTFHINEYLNFSNYIFCFQILLQLLTISYPASNSTPLHQKRWVWGPLHEAVVTYLYTVWKFPWTLKERKVIRIEKYLYYIIQYWTYFYWKLILWNISFHFVYAEECTHRCSNSNLSQFFALKIIEIYFIFRWSNWITWEMSDFSWILFCSSSAKSRVKCELKT